MFSRLSLLKGARPLGAWQIRTLATVVSAHGQATAKSASPVIRDRATFTIRVGWRLAITNHALGC